MIFRCIESATVREQKKALAGWIQAGGLLATACFLCWLGLQVGHWGKGRLTIIVWIGAVAVVAMSFAALNWALDAQKTATWMKGGALEILPNGLSCAGAVHPWSTLEVHADTGEELLIVTEAHLKIPIDWIDQSDTFRTELRRASNRTVNI